MKRIMLAGAIACAAMAVHADDGAKFIGSWMVTNKDDRFGEGGTFLAMTGDGVSRILAVRCIEKELSIGILLMDNDPKPVSIGDIFSVKLRTDKEPVVDASGVAINGRLIQIKTEPDMVRSIRRGRETAVRLENSVGVSQVTVFKTIGTAKAFARLAAECNLD